MMWIKQRADCCKSAVLLETAAAFVLASNFLDSNHMQETIPMISYLRILILAAGLFVISADAAQNNEKYARQRQAMVEEIADDARRLVRYIDKDTVSDRVMHAMATVPRHLFVPDNQRRYAYENRPLPIGYGQTISQPYIVALMTDMLELKDSSEVLEIGTGTGYQAAILSRLAKRVYTIERIPALAESARLRLAELGYDNIETRCADGYLGWPERAPFDAIVVTAAAPYIPASLQDQLKPGGRMAIPVGLPSMHQELMLVTRDLEGGIHSKTLLGVAFVPLIREERDST